MDLIYAGIGPRHGIDQATLNIMSSIATQLGKDGWILRSGDAIGCDRAFQKGAPHRQVFLPHTGYNGSTPNGIDKAVRLIDQHQIDIAQKAYERNQGSKPDWFDLKQSTLELLCRNVPVILGENLDEPVNCVITAMPMGYAGGTLHAITIAEMHGVSVFNILQEEDQNLLIEFVSKTEKIYHQKVQLQAV